MTAELTELDDRGRTPDSWTPAGGVWAPRRVHVYWLEITYPPGSLAPGWHPAAWDSAARVSRRTRRYLAKQTFRWPRERLFLSSSGAYGRACYLHWCGAQARVHRSLAVAWPVLPDPDVEFDASGIPLEKGRKL